jgi:hypothetical protein
MRMLVFKGAQAGDYPGIVFVPDVALPSGCAVCQNPIVHHACNCGKAVLYHCSECLSAEAIWHTKRIIGHNDCVAPPPTPRHGDLPSPGFYVGEAPVRPSGAAKYRFERLLDHGRPQSPPWLTEKEFLQEYKIGRTELRKLAVAGAVNVTHCRNQPRWHYARRAYEWSFETFYLPGSLHEISAAAQEVAVRAEEARRAREEREKEYELKREQEMVAWREERARRNQQSLAYRAGIAARAYDYSRTGVDPAIFGDGCRQIIMPSLTDYEELVAFEEVNFKDIWLTGEEDRRLRGAS